MWDKDLAKLFKERNPENRIGPVVGKIASVNPLRVTILNGEIILQAEQLYISEGLKNKSYKIDLEGGAISGSVSPSGNLRTLNIDDADTTLTFELNINDEVLLIPAEGEQVFFIVDKVHKAGG